MTHSTATHPFCRQQAMISIPNVRCLVVKYHIKWGKYSVVFSRLSPRGRLCFCLKALFPAGLNAKEGEIFFHFHKNIFPRGYLYTTTYSCFQAEKVIGGGWRRRLRNFTDVALGLSLCQSLPPPPSDSFKRTNLFASAAEATAAAPPTSRLAGYLVTILVCVG